jgi:hypothetical protein
MSLNYPNQEEEFILGSEATPVTLTTSYTNNVSDPFHVEHYAQLTFCVEYTAGVDGNGSSVEIKVEGSPDLLSNDSVTPIYYQETSSSTSSGTITHSLAEHTIENPTGGSTLRAMFYVPPAFKTLQVSAKETLAGSDPGTLKLRLITSGK